jgi:hypothetical protein
MEVNENKSEGYYIPDERAGPWANFVQDYLSSCTEHDTQIPTVFPFTDSQ